MIKVKGRLVSVLRLLLIINIVSVSTSGNKKYAWTNAISKHIDICKEPECYNRGRLIVESMNRYVDPCTDFYEYACGNWKTLNPIPSHQYEWSIEGKLDFQSIHEMSDLLKMSIRFREPEDVKQAKRLYQICKNMPAQPKMEARQLKEFVKRAGIWPMFHPEQKTKVSWLDIHNNYVKEAGDAGIFGFGFYYDHEINEVFIKLAYPSMPLGLIKQTREWDADENGKYRQFLLKLARMVMDKHNEPPEKDLLQDIADVVEFRQKLEKNSRVDTVEFSPMSIKFLHLWYHIRVTSQKAGTKIPWIQVFQTLFRDTYLNASENTTIMVQNKDTFAYYPRLLSTTPKHVIANHLHLYFIEKHILLNEELNIALTKLLVRNGKIIGTTMPRMDRPDNCIFSHPLKETLGRMYVHKYFNEETREKVLHYAKKVIEMIKTHITSSTWLDDRTKELLLDKLAHVDLNIGYRNKHWGKHAEQRDLKMTPYRAISFYTPKENSIFISAGYFRAPVYDKNLPSAVNHGTIITFLAYEIYHALYVQHSRTEATTSKGVCRYCYSDVMTAAFQKKTKCFVDLYTDLVDKNLEKIKPTPKSDGTRTLLENIADVMGIRTAMDAFKKRLWEKKGKCWVIPHLKDITCEKLFFLSYAATYCTVSPAWRLVKRIQQDAYSTNRFRVNVPLSTMEEFRQAYHCPADSPMVSKKSCFLW